MSKVPSNDVIKSHRDARGKLSALWSYHKYLIPMIRFRSFFVLRRYVLYIAYPDSKVRGANMGPIWGRQDPDGPHVGPMNFAIWVRLVNLRSSIGKKTSVWNDEIPAIFIFTLTFTLVKYVLGHRNIICVLMILSKYMKLLLPLLIFRMITAREND